MRKELALFAAIAALFTFVSFSAQAMPAASLKGVSADQTIQVSGGCGPHRHRDHHGHCRHD
jgi:Spy/CpxP family protein refolding chaperone